MPSSFVRRMAEKRWPWERISSPPKWMSIVVQLAHASVIAVNVGSSATRRRPSVSSENTTPKPNVASGGLRSMTVTSWRGSAFLSRIER